jgi:hypothetical protein
MQAAMFRHGEVEKEDVRLCGNRLGHGLMSIRGLPDDPHVPLGIDQRTKTGSKNGVIIGDEHSNGHGEVPDRKGISTWIVVPRP